MTFSTHLLTEDHLLQLAVAYGAWAVFVSVALEGTGLPVPSESILIAVAALTADRGLGADAVLPVILAAACGAVLGDNVGYGFGRAAGLPLIRRLGIPDRRQRLGTLLFDRYGGWVVFGARFVSILRTCVNLMAGTTRMAWLRFLLFNVSGACVWAAVVGFGAYGLGQRARAATGWMSLVLLALAAVAAVAGAIALKRKAETLQAEADAMRGR